MASNLATIRVELIANAQKFKTNIQKASTSLTKVSKAGKKTQDRMKGVQKAFQNTAGSIAAVQGPLGPVAGRISAIGAIIGRVSPLALGFTAVVVGLGLAFTKLVKNVAQVETQMLKLEGILKATGNAAGLSLTEIENLSTEIGIATLASTREVRDAAGIMLTFKSITGDTFRDALRLSQDLAEVGFGSVKTGATQLGKALEDPIVGLGALRRVGVSFTDAQKEMIKVLTMTGRKAEAQRIILKALDEQVGGAGVKAATGLAGAVDSLKENLDIFFERSKFGTAIVNGLTSAMNFLAKAFGDVDLEAKKLTTIKQVTDSIKEMKTEMESLNIENDLSNVLNEGAMTGDQKRYAELQKLISEHMAQLEVLRSQEERDLIRDEAKKKSKEEEAKKETDLGKIRESNEKTHKRNTDRAIQDMGKTQRELKNLNDLRKVEDELRKKIGSDGVEAERAIQAELLKSIEGITERNRIFEEARKKQEELNKIAEGTGQIFVGVGEKINDAMVRGKLSTLDFKSILLEMVIALQKMIFKVMVLDEIQRKIEERMKKGGLSVGGIFKSVVGAVTGGSDVDIGGSHASGGTIQTNKPSLVGERGPELFVPNTAGTIKNNSDTKQMVGGGGGGINVTQNLNFAVGVTNTVRAEVMNMLPAIQQSTVQAVAEAKQRGGKFSKAFGS